MWQKKSDGEIMILEKNSPFEPRKPVSPEKLEGRFNIIEDYVRYLSLAVNGQPQHFYLNGNRRVGKSSIATYMLEYARVKYGMIGIHVYNDGIHSIDDLINNIVEKLLNEIKDESFGTKILNYFHNHIETTGFLGNSIKLRSDSPNMIGDIKNSFADFIVNTLKNFDEGKGLFIVIDDINGLSQTPDFANWYKSFADTLSTTFNTPIPLVMMLTSHPKVVKLLYKHNPSFNRIFVYRPIGFLQKNEVKDFFIKSFGSRCIQIEENALNLMVEFSAGSPTMMQNIGDEIYLLNKNNVISKEITLEGIKQAAREIELRYLQNTLDEFNIAQSDLNILRVLGKDFINNAYENYSFKIDEIADKLSKLDEELLDEFIQKALQADIIEIKNEDEFIFTNDLYPIYFAIAE